MENNYGHSKSPIDGLKPKTAFKVGLLAGLGIMFVIGFFVLLGIMLNGNGFSMGKNSKDKANYNVVVSPDKITGSTVDDQLASLAENLNIDVEEFNSCLTGDTYVSKVNADAQQAQAAGGRGTPYSVILYGTQKVPIPGALPYESVKATLDSLLAGETAANNDPNINITPYDEDKDWLRGDENAPISIIEFSDIDCPFCKRFHPTMKQVLEDYDGQVNWVYRHFPLPTLHPDAPRKAAAAECAGHIGGNNTFWAFVDSLSAS